MGHQHVGGVLLIGLCLVPQQGDFIAVLDYVHLVDSWSHGELHLWDLVVVHIRLGVEQRGGYIQLLNKFGPVESHPLF